MTHSYHDSFPLADCTKRSVGCLHSGLARVFHFSAAAASVLCPTSPRLSAPHRIHRTEKNTDCPHPWYRTVPSSYVVFEMLASPPQKGQPNKALQATAAPFGTFDVSVFIGCLLCAQASPSAAVPELDRWAAWFRCSSAPACHLAFRFA